MHRISMFAVGLFAAGFALAAAPAFAYQVEEYVLPPATGVYQAYSPYAPVIPYYSYRVAAPVYGPVYQYGPAPYYVPSTTVIRQRTFFGPRRVRTMYRAW